MRHNKKFNHLGRTADHRAALLSNLAVALIQHKRITTTLAKAKALKKYVEPLITRSKNDTTNSRRVVFRYLQNKEAVTELFKEISVKVADRPGGYTRVIKLGTVRVTLLRLHLLSLLTMMRTWLSLQRLKLRRLVVAVVLQRRLMHLQRQLRTLLKKQRLNNPCLLYTSPSPRDPKTSRMPSSA